MIKSIDFDNVILFHKKIIEQTGGSQGVRDRNLVESALNKAFVSYDGNDLYPTLEEKISAITYSLIQNHAFVDGNKRIGVAVMVLLLKINNVKITYTQQELIDLGLGTASKEYNQIDIQHWIKDHRQN
jgi:death-on-curing protein